MLYSYRAYGREGNQVRGVVEADSEFEARNKIAAQNLALIELRTNQNNLLTSPVKIKLPPSTMDWKRFCKGYAGVLDAGMNEIKALRHVGKTTTNAILKDRVEKVVKKVTEGIMLPTAMEQVGGFPGLIVGLLKVGDESGSRTKVLRTLAEHYDREQRTANAIRSGMTYPVLVVIAAILATIFLLATLVPQLSGIVKDLGQELPASTRFVIGLSDFMAAFWWLVLAGLVGLGYLGYRYINTRPGRKVWDRWLLRLPGFGVIIKNQIISRFCRTTILLLRSGKPLQSSLKDVAEAVGNTVYSEAIMRIDSQLKTGLLTLSASLRQYPKLFDEGMCNMVELGEGSGKLDEVMESCAVDAEEEVETRSKMITSAIEPLLIGFVGIVVGGLIVSLYSPLFNIIGGLAK